MLVLAAAALALVRPPTAYVDTGATQVPLTISSWCWADRCGAPIAAARRVATVRRGASVTVVLRFDPTEVHLAVGGVRIMPTVRGHDVTWRARRSGGLSLTATGVRGFVTYVGRLGLR